MQFWLVLLSTISYTWASIESDLRPEVNKYLRELNAAGLLHHRDKRQSGTPQYYYVTQCGFNNTVAPTDSPSIEVFGTNLENSNSVQKAAELVYRMVRFMPRDLFVALAGNSSVGLFDYRGLPAQSFSEFDDMPVECGASCNTQAFIPGVGTYDCSQWCTNSMYPYYQNYPLNYLWAYGNFSRTFVVESNVMCQGFNPSGGAENYLIREYALTIMTRLLGEGKLAEIAEAYELSIQSQTWSQLINMYDYFMKGALIWFNGVSNRDISGMNCKFYKDNSIPECVTGYHMRKYLKVKDLKLYTILNKVFNNNRDYAQSYTEVCDW